MPTTLFATINKLHNLSSRTDLRFLIYYLKIVVHTLLTNIKVFRIAYDELDPITARSTRKKPSLEIALTTLALT